VTGLKAMTNGEVWARERDLPKREEILKRLAAAEDVLIDRRAKSVEADKVATEAIRQRSTARDAYDRQALAVREIVRELARYTPEPPLTADLAAREATP
jgi:hypothetical protein